MNEEMRRVIYRIFGYLPDNIVLEKYGHKLEISSGKYSICLDKARDWEDGTPKYTPSRFRYKDVYYTDVYLDGKQTTAEELEKIFCPVIEGQIIPGETEAEARSRLWGVKYKSYLPDLPIPFDPWGESGPYDVEEAERIKYVLYFENVKNGKMYGPYGTANNRPSKSGRYIKLWLAESIIDFANEVEDPQFVRPVWLEE